MIDAHRRRGFIGRVSAVMDAVDLVLHLVLDVGDHFRRRRAIRPLVPVLKYATLGCFPQVGRTITVDHAMAFCFPQKLVNHLGCLVGGANLIYFTENL